MSSGLLLRSLQLSLLLLSGVAAAAPPANDDWANRTVINPVTLLSPGGYGDTQASIAEATTEATDPLLVCKNGDPAQRGNTVWYSVRLVGAGQNFYVNLSALGYDSIVAIYTGTPGSFRPVVGGCNDDGAPTLASALAGVRLLGETDYSIVVARPAQNTNTATLSFSARPAPLYNVTKTADTSDGVCDADCSLREAIGASNAAPGAVLVPAGDYPLARSGSDNTNANGDLDLLNGMAVYGAGATATRLIGISGERVIDLGSGAGDALGHTFQLTDLTVRNASAGFAFGGGINASAGATSPGNDHLALQRVEVRNNSTQLAGGGVRSNGPTVIIDSTIADNTAASDGGGLSFGGDANTRVDVVSSTISGNSSTSGFSGGGGGVHSTSNTVIYNSTISANLARFNGGGVLSTTFSGRVSLIGVTLANNRSDSDGNGSGVGGGLRVEGNFGSVFNSVFSGNRAGTGAIADDCDKSASVPAMVVDSNHLEAAASTCGFGASDVLGQPALLGPLADNGGPTLTHLPQSSSPVIDTGAALQCLSTDQRGMPRPQDGDGIGGAQCDKGAVEAAQFVPDSIFSDGFE